MLLVNKKLHQGGARVLDEDRARHHGKLAFRSGFPLTPPRSIEAKDVEIAKDGVGYRQTPQWVNAEKSPERHVPSPVRRGARRGEQDT
jgi:hypothetical protein